MVNTKVESVLLSGETYEYMIVNEKSVPKLNKLIAEFPSREKIEFLDINKVRIQTVKEVKQMFVCID